MILYIIQTTLVFSLLYTFYVIFLRKLTFYKLNRLFLLLIIPLSLLLPLINNLIPSIPHSYIEIPILEEVSYYNSQNLASIEHVKNDTSIDYSLIIGFIYILGVILNISKLFASISKLFSIKRGAVTQKKNGYNLLLTNVPEVFSFFNWIFIPKTYKCDELIIEHERAHIRLKHSYDMVFYELYIALFWFNPISYFYRKSIKSIHEFQADSAVLKNHVPPSNYLQLLLETMDMKSPNNIYSYFNHPILKQRIEMITKRKSNEFAKLKYLFLIPVCVLLLSAFAKPILKEIPLKNEMNFYENGITPPSLFPVKNGSITDITAYFGEKGKHAKVNKGIIHTGIDIKAPSGTPIMATADGVIAKAAIQGDWGNLIVVVHDDGYETWYAHLKDFNINENQEIEKGDIIGYVGSTGKSTGPHLHYEVKKNGQHLNPLDYLQ